MASGPVNGDTPSVFGGGEQLSGRNALRVAAVAALGGLMFGYDSAVINGAVAAIQRHFGISNASLGFAVASALLGAAAGAMIGSCVLVAGTLGVIAGGVFGDWLLRRGRATGRLDAAMLAMLFGAAGAAWYPLQSSAPAIAAGFMLAMFGAFMVIGCAGAALLDITPNRLRGQATAVLFFVTSVLGIGLGPTAVALVTDQVFGYPEAVGQALAIVPGMAFLLAGLCFLAARAPYCRSCLATQALQAR